MSVDSWPKIPAAMAGEFPPVYSVAATDTEKCGECKLAYLVDLAPEKEE